MVALSRRLRHWSVSLLGLLLASLSSLMYVSAAEPGEWLILLLPTVLSCLVVGFGVWLSCGGLDPEQTFRIAVWCSGGVFSLGLLTVWAVGHNAIDGVPLGQAVESGVMYLTVGGLAGSLVGYYQVKHEEQSGLAERVQTAVDATTDGVAILDEARRFRSVNQSYLDMHGIESESELLGRHYREFSLVVDTDRLTDEVVPTVVETGQWRGELMGRRRDGTTFPKELTVNHTSDGGIVVVARDISERRQYEQRLRAQATAMDNAVDGMAILDADGEYSYVNEAHANVYGFDDPDELLGRSWRCLYDDDELARFEEDIMPKLGEEGQWRGEAVGRRADGTTYPQELSLTTLHGGGLVCVVRDITERKEWENKLKTLQETALALRHLETEEEVVRYVVDAVEEVIEKPFSIVWSYDTERSQLLPVVASDPAMDLFESRGTSLDALVVSEGMRQMAAFRGSDPEYLESYQSIEATQRFDLPLADVVYEPLGSHGLLAIGARDQSEFTASDRYLADLLARNAVAALDRIERERTIESLQSAMRRMVQATDAAEVAELTVETTNDVLGYQLAGVWLVDDSGTRLEPVEATHGSQSIAEELPTFTADRESIAWTVFERGETMVFDDVSTDPRVHNPETVIRSELVLPLGNHGVLIVGSCDPAQFDEVDVNLATVLGANAEAALTRAEHEAELVNQRDRLEFLNSLLRHDILNGMIIIHSRAEFLLETDLDEEQRQYAETVRRWCDDIVDLVQNVRAMLDAFAGSGRVETRPMDLSALLHEEVDRVETTYPEVSFSTSIPDDVTVAASDVLSEVLGNVVTNAVEHNCGDDPTVTVTVERGDDTATVRVADNGPGVPPALKDGIFRRDRTGHVKSAGTGFGLFFVDTMVDQYDGTVRVEDNDPTGAVFVIDLPLA